LSIDFKKKQLYSKSKLIYELSTTVNNIPLSNSKYELNKIVFNVEI